MEEISRSFPSNKVSLCSLVGNVFPTTKGKYSKLGIFPFSFIHRKLIYKVVLETGKSSKPLLGYTVPLA